MWMETAQSNGCHSICHIVKSLSCFTCRDVDKISNDVSILSMTRRRVPSKSQCC